MPTLLKSTAKLSIPLDGVLDMISSLGKGAELGKIDIKQAFRLLIVNPTDYRFKVFDLHFITIQN
jgi:hypothetical protein